MILGMVLFCKVIESNALIWYQNLGEALTVLTA